MKDRSLSNLSYSHWLEVLWPSDTYLTRQHKWAPLFFLHIKLLHPKPTKHSRAQAGCAVAQFTNYLGDYVSMCIWQHSAFNEVTELKKAIGSICEMAIKIV